MSIKMCNVLPSIPVIFPTHELCSLSQPPSAVLFLLPRWHVYVPYDISRVYNCKTEIPAGIWASTTVALANDKSKPRIWYTRLSRAIWETGVCVCSQTVNSGVATPVETLSPLWMTSLLDGAARSGFSWRERERETSQINEAYPHT